MTFLSPPASATRGLLLLTASVAAVGIVGHRRAYAQACVDPAGPPAATFLCSGAATTTQDLDGADLVVTTDPGFSVVTGSLEAFDLDATSSLSFEDLNGSTITGVTRGIEANNGGSGALSITTTGDVTGLGSDGIDAIQTSTATTGDLTINVNTVSGGDEGIEADNDGTGGISITATGDITGGSGAGNDGINANLDAASTGDLTINVVNVTAGGSGIESDNLGTGGTSITATGNITAATEDGIFVFLDPSTTGDLTIDAVNVSGGDEGIDVRHDGTGDISIVASGDVTGFDDAIEATANGTGDVSVTITGSVESDTDIGIEIDHSGTGDISIVATGNVTGGDEAIDVDHNGDGSISIVTTGNVAGVDEAIQAALLGTGDISITASGSVDSQMDEGFDVDHDGIGNISIVAESDVTGGFEGIDADHDGDGNISIIANGDVTSSDQAVQAALLGTGDISITTSGLVESTTDEGIDVDHDGTGNVSIVAEDDVTGFDEGIDVDHDGDGDISIVAMGDVMGVDPAIQAALLGTGNISITTSGLVDSTTDEGFDIDHDGTGDIKIIAMDDVTASDEGFDIDHDGDGDVSVIAESDVIGGFEGIDIDHDGNGSISVVAEGDVTASDQAVQAALLGTGDISITVDGTVTSATDEGIDVDHDGTGDVSIVAMDDVTGGDEGIDVDHDGDGNVSVVAMGDVAGVDPAIQVNVAGSGDVAIMASGSVTSTTDEGIEAAVGDGDITILADGAVTGDDQGIEADIIGSGNISITTNGPVIGGTGNAGIDANIGGGPGDIAIIADDDVTGDGDGILTSTFNAGTTSIIALGNVTGSGGNGIEVATTNGGGATSITVDGDVVGSANGILLDSDSGGQTNTITIETGASVTGGSGAAILDAASGGSDETTVITSGLLDGDVILGSGDDVFEYMVGASITGEIDGGGDIDAFILSGDSTGLAIDDSIDVSDFDFDNNGSAPSGSVGVTGFESFTKAGSSTFELTGTNDEAGLFDLMAGGLVFSGTFDDLSIAGAAGTSLGGGGTIGSFDTFGTVAPGAPDAIGTLSVTGDATFGAGSVFAVDVLDSVTGGDLLDVTGMVNISGGATVAVSLVGDAMNLPAAGSVTIISAGGGVIGDFASVTDDVPDIGFTAETLPNSVVLTLGADPDGDTSPQGGPAAALRGGLETTLVFANALRQGAANPGSNFLFERERLSFLPVGRDSAGEFSAIGGVFGAITDVRSSGTRDGYDVELAGLYLGTARSFGLASGTLTAGGAIAYSEADVETIGNDADVEAFQIGLFARYDGGALHASGALSYATLDFDFIRTPVAGVVATGDADGDGVGLSLEISYDVSKQLGATSDRMELRPFFGFDATYADRDGFTETGAGVLNMAVEGEDAFTGFARFGFELANTYEVGSGALRASATFGYERAFGQLDAATSSSLVGLGGTFSDPLADIDEDRILLGAKAAFGSGKVKGFVGYEGAIGNESEDHRGAIGFEMAF